jgi:hypothetical protein
MINQNKKPAAWWPLFRFYGQGRKDFESLPAVPFQKLLIWRKL